MKLILSSCDFRNEKSRKVIFAHLKKKIEKCKVLFIPNEKATPKAIMSGKYHTRMQEFGFAKENVWVLDDSQADQFRDLNPDLVYISGGNTFATMQKIRACRFDKEIIRYVKEGAIYVGGSAGAHIASADIMHVAAFDDLPDEMSNFCGLGLFQGILLCHYTVEREPLYRQLQCEKRYPVYALTDEMSLVVDHQKITFA